MTKPSLARRLVLGELAKLSKGRLSLRLPEGTELTLGDPQASKGARIEISDENALAIGVIRSPRASHAAEDSGVSPWLPRSRHDAV